MSESAIEARIKALDQLKWQDIRSAAEAAGLPGRANPDEPWDSEENLRAIAVAEQGQGDADEPEPAVSSAKAEPKAGASKGDGIEVNPLADIMRRNGMLLCDRCGDQAQTDNDGFICTRGDTSGACPQLQKNK